MTVIEELRTRSLDVIFAEPVGSCTDISATVFGPLREEFDGYRVAPFTVLADPARAKELLSEDADSDLAFLFQTNCGSRPGMHDQGDLIRMHQGFLE